MHVQQNRVRLKNGELFQTFPQAGGGFHKMAQALQKRRHQIAQGFFIVD
jgi:hypothetical protein